MPTLLITDVTRAVGVGTPLTVLNGVSLSIPQGDFVAIEGPSGAGKSSLLNIIGALDAPTSGSYTIDGREIVAAPERDLSRIRSGTFGFVFQAFHLLDRRPAVESVELGLLYRGVALRERRRRALHAMEALGVGELAGTAAGRLSGGEQQRVALARAMASDAPVVIADEPTGNLDTENAHAVVQSLRELNARGTTIVLVTHSPEVAAAASRRIRMVDGVVVDGADGAAPVGKAVRADRAQGAAQAGGPGTASRVRAADLLRDAWANIASRAGKSAGLVGAVALAVALAVGSLGVAGSARSQVSMRFDEHSNRDVTLEWSVGSLAAQTAHMRATIPARLTALAGVDKAALIENHGQTSVQAGLGREARDTTGFSGTHDGVAAARMGVTWATGVPHEVGRGEVLLGATFAGQLELAPLSLDPVVLIDGEPRRVVGLVTSSPRLPELLAGAYLSAADAASLGPPQRSRALLLTRAGAAQQVSRQAPLVVDPFDTAAVTVQAPIDPGTLRSQIEADVATTLLGMTTLALLAAVVGLGNAMVLAVIERKREFGLRRAVGAQRRHIAALVVCESALIGVLGGAAGLFLGLAGVLAVTIGQRWVPVLDLGLAPLAIAGGAAVGAVGGVAAAVRAARMQPAQALRS